MEGLEAAAAAKELASSANFGSGCASAAAAASQQPQGKQQGRQEAGNGERARWGFGRAPSSKRAAWQPEEKLKDDGEQLVLDKEPRGREQNLSYGGRESEGVSTAVGSAPSKMIRPVRPQKFTIERGKKRSWREMAGQSMDPMDRAQLDQDGSS